jgi:DEAD/DEAH box helicase domain-containing protein
MRIVIFDLETRLHADQLDKNKEIGWARLRAGDGGISALAVYDLQDEWLYLYDEHSVREVATHLEKADVVVGFRSEGFDVPVVEGLLGRKMRLREHLDLYALIARTNASSGRVGTTGDNTLDAICRRTFGRGKSGSGAHAPELYSQRRFGELFNYCGQDVRLTRDLLLHIGQHGGVQNFTGSFLHLDLPAQVTRGLNVRP